MKRFWSRAEAVADGERFAVTLDGRPVRTPRGNRLVAPTAALGQAIAAEWQAVEAEVRPHAMPLTGLANAAIDLVAEDPPAFAATLSAYARSDMLCYRAEHPQALVQRQAAQWDPILAWAEARFDIVVKRTAGIAPIGQPPLTLERLDAAYAAQPPFRLAALSPLVTLAGSAILPLALLDGRLDPESAWAAALLDELWQAEQWGEDALAAASRADRRHQFNAACRFLSLLGGVTDLPPLASEQPTRGGETC